MTPDAIVSTAGAQGLRVLAIADHNEISSVAPAQKAAKSRGVYIVPAVELSTSDGHLLCYLPTLEALERFFGKLNIVDRGSQTSRCQTAMLDCLSLLDQEGGFGILAHVDVPGGFEIQNPTHTPHKLDVLCHKGLLAIELKSADSPIAYSPSDPDPARKQCGAQRISRLHLAPKQYLARVLNSDAHNLKALGHNAAGLRRVTRVKMQEPSFSGLRIALEDSDARIRLEDEVPASVARILGVSIDGGFLDGQRVHFSPNLNCIIGGRGSGKSTLFEAVRCLSGEPTSSDHIDSDIWPRELWLHWEDEAGQRHSLYRPHGQSITNDDDPLAGPTAFPVESYGQGETVQISKDSKENPGALLKYLDRFIDTRDAQREEDAARAELRQIDDDLLASDRQIALIPGVEKQLQLIRSQIAVSEKENVKELIALQRSLAGEQQLRREIVENLATMKKELGAYSPKQTIETFTTLADPTSVTLGRVEFDAILQSARVFEAEATTAQGTTGTSFATFKAAVDAKLAEWKAKEAASVQKLEAKRKELEKSKVSINLDFIEALAKSEAKHNADLVRLKAFRPKKLEQGKLRLKALERRWAARAQIETKRIAYGIEATQRLRDGLTDLTVSLKFGEGAYSPEAAELIRSSMDWRTSQVPRAPLLMERLGIRGLIQAIDKRDTATITAVEYEPGQQVFSRADAETLLAKLAEPAIRYALEVCPVNDLPQLNVSRKVVDAGGERHRTRAFAKLSLGQQQSVLLALMLCSNNNNPLIIDQPEDNLDGEFIYHSIVPVLRLAKERRQIIVATHNANIAVLGDAEQIVPLKSTSEKGAIQTTGSIDDVAVRDLTCDILEGTREAFRRRAKVYGPQ